MIRDKIGRMVSVRCAECNSKMATMWDDAGDEITKTFCLICFQTQLINVLIYMVSDTGVKADRLPSTGVRK